VKQLDRQLLPRAIHSAALRGRCRVLIEPTYEGQVVAVVGKKREWHDHAKRDLAEAPARDGTALGRPQGIVVHPDPESLQATFAGERIVGSKHHDFYEPQLNEVKDGKPNCVKRSQCGSEQPVVGREVFRG